MRCYLTFVLEKIMRLQKTFLILMTLFASFQICLAQESIENENWIGTIEGGQPSFLIHNFKNYSQTDVLNAKGKLEHLKKAKAKDEWEGSYNLSGDLTDNKLIWNSEFGFVNYYIYTCAIELRALNYGRIISSYDSIILFTEKTQPPFTGTGKSGYRKLIKVKWGDRHYLIDEENLEDFCELAAGYYEIKNKEIEIDGEKIETQVVLWNSFWVMDNDNSKNKAFGLPILPKFYEKYAKLPIETKIISLGNIKKAEADEEYFSSSTTHYLTINAGKNKGIKEGMSFYVPQLKERISIEKVYKKISIASLPRDFDKETQKENCFSNYEEIPCVKPIIGMQAKTISAELLID